MATSGTVGQTSLDLAKLIEKTFRRCGIPTGAITPELIDIAKENLFLLFQNYSNRGINLWCVDQKFVGLSSYKGTYSMDVGTIDVLNANYRQLTDASASSVTYGATTIDFDMASAQQVVMFGLKPDIDYNAVSFTFSQSTDGASFAVLGSWPLQNLSADTNYWFAIDPNGQDQYYRITLTTAHTAADLNARLISQYADIPMARMNRDDWFALPNKDQTGTRALQYFFNRQMTPTLTTWPIVSAETDCLALVTHRQIQDVGNDLTATIEVPDRWVDAVLWELAAMCAVEIPQVPQERIQLVQQSAMSAMINAEGEERDTAPIYLAPNIGVYTR